MATCRIPEDHLARIEEVRAAMARASVTTVSRSDAMRFCIGVSLWTVRDWERAGQPLPTMGQLDDLLASRPREPVVFPS